MLLPPTVLALGVLAGAQNLLPPEEVAKPWRASGEPYGYTAETLSQFIDGAAEIYLEYGFVQLASQEYLLGEDSIVCNVFEMRDPEAAFGIFSYSRSPEKSSLFLGDGGFKGGLQVAFWQARYFVVVESYSAAEGVEQTLLTFARWISERIGTHAAEPPVLQKLPRRHLIPGSEKLLRGRLSVDSLFFLGEAELLELAGADLVLSAEYQGSLKKAKLFLVIFREEQKARHTYELWRGALTRQEGYVSAGHHWVKDGRYFLLRQRGDSLALIADASSLAEAEAILSEDPGRP